MGQVGVALGSLWDNFWHMRVTLGALWLHFGVTLGPLWAHRRRMAGRYDVCRCGFDGVIARPKRAHKQEIHIFPRILLFKEATGVPEKVNSPASRTAWEGIGGW